MNITCITYCFLILFLTVIGHAQVGEAELILKDSTRIKGIGEISGISSIISVKFKNDTLKYRTYAPDEIIGINIKENEYYRSFRYKNTDKSKYPQLMEIVSKGKLSLYIKLFGDGVVSNMPLQKRANQYLNRYQASGLLEDLFGHQNFDQSLISQNFIYVEMNFPRYSYYVGERHSNNVEYLYTRGLPFAKSFKKAMKERFSNCPSLLKKVEGKELTKEDIILVLYYYNEKCLD